MHLFDFPPQCVIRPGAAALYSWCSIVLTRRRCSRPFSSSAARLPSSLLLAAVISSTHTNALHCHFISGSGVIKGSLGPLQPGFPNLRLHPSHYYRQHCSNPIPSSSPQHWQQILKIFSSSGKHILVHCSPKLHPLFPTKEEHVRRQVIMCCL